jgi:hypothetical protein
MRADDGDAMVFNAEIDDMPLDGSASARRCEVSQTHLRLWKLP